MSQDPPRIPSSVEIIPIMRDVISQLDVAHDQVVRTLSTSTATFDNALRPLVQLQDQLQERVGVIFMLQYAAPDKATQDTVNQAISLWSKAEARWSTRRDLFHLLQAAHEKVSESELDQESQVLFRAKMLDFEESGVGVLTPSETTEYMKISLEIDTLCRAFQHNLASEQGGIWFSSEDLDGVPSENLEKWESHSGKRFVPFANGGTSAVLQHSHNPETRKLMYIGDRSKTPENGPVFEEIIERRFTQALKLGYPDHASFRMQRRLAKSAEWVETFLDQVKDGLVPLARRELAVMQQRRLRDLQERGQVMSNTELHHFPVWDKAYYMHLIKKEFDIDQLKISEYFPLESTIKNMLIVFSSLLSLRFDMIPQAQVGEQSQWHDTVQTCSVWENDGSEFVGYLYFDLLWREYKYRGNQNVTHSCGFERSDGSRHYPSTILMCSFPTPAPSKCVLLKHHQVVTLFHGNVNPPYSILSLPDVQIFSELGHAIHNLVCKTKYTRFHGTNLPPDFGEMPSVMLENWCWMSDTLKDLSRHYTTVDPKYLQQWQAEHPGSPVPVREIPNDLIQKLIEHRFFGRALYHSYQLTISIFDLRIHRVQTTEELAEINFPALWYRLRKDLEGFYFGEEGERGLEYGQFTHLTAGYDVGYYSYLVCSAFAQDLFKTKFAGAPNDPETWMAYRRGILQYGGGHPDMMQMLESFLGHPPNSGALVDSLKEASREFHE